MKFVVYLDKESDITYSYRFKISFYIKDILSTVQNKFSYTAEEIKKSYILQWKINLCQFHAITSFLQLYFTSHLRIEFKLSPGDLLMMDNYRLLHGRTSYDANEGNRFLQGCYIDYDSTEGKLKHLKRKFNL